MHDLSTNSLVLHPTVYWSRRSTLLASRAITYEFGNPTMARIDVPSWDSFCLVQFVLLHVALIASTDSAFSRPFSRNWVVTQKCASADNPYSRQNRDSIIVVLITLVTNALRLLRGKIFCQLYNPLESTHTSWPRGNSLYKSCQNASQSIIKAKTHYSTAQLPSGNRDKTAV